MGHGFRECHKCRFDRVAKNLDTASAADIAEARTACTRCKGMSETSRKGISMVTLGGMEDACKFLFNNTSRDYLHELRRERAETVTALSAEAEKAVRVILDLFKSLNKAQIFAIHGLLNGKTLAGIGAEIGMTKQGVSKTLKTAARKNIAIAVFLRDILHTTTGWDSRKAEAKLSQ